MDTEEAYAWIERAIAAGRPAHGYLVAGSLRGCAMQLANRVLKLLFPDWQEGRPHPDIHWLEPEKKTRIISVEAVRSRLVDPMSSTAYAGGWKAGVIVGADRMKTEGANAFLKTLEEPTPRTIFLLLTDAPDGILPTIISRCQTLTLPDAGRRTLEEPFRARALEILAAPVPSGAAARAAIAGRFSALLEEMKEEASARVSTDAEEDAEDDALEARIMARYREYRAEFSSLLLDWFRDVMAVKAAGADAPQTIPSHAGTIRERAAGITLAAAFRNLEAIEEFVRTIERNVPEVPALSFLADRLDFGGGVQQ